VPQSERLTAKLVPNSAPGQDIVDTPVGHRQCKPIHRKLWRVLQFGLSPTARPGSHHEIATRAFAFSSRLRDVALGRMIRRFKK
jgi:hypothetical protein